MPKQPSREASKAARLCSLGGFTGPGGEDGIQKGDYLSTCKAFIPDSEGTVHRIVIPDAALLPRGVSPALTLTNPLSVHY